MAHRRLCASCAIAYQPLQQQLKACPAPLLTCPQVAAEGASNPYAIPAGGRGLPREITLYQYEVCPFCCKVKAFLDYYKVRAGRGPGGGGRTAARLRGLP